MSKGGQQAGQQYAARRDPEDVSGAKTFGHNLLTTENIEKLANYATHWAVVVHFENDDEIPNHNLFPVKALVNIFEQGRLCRASLLAGFRTARQPNRPVPPTFFRTLDFLLQYQAAGNNYRAITDKEEAKGIPPAGWCRPPVVASPDDAPAATEALLRGATPDVLARVPANDPIRLFYSARSWCVIYSFHIAASTVRVEVGKSPEEMYQLYKAGKLSMYSAVVGLQEHNPPSNLWVPPCVMIPLGALLYMHGHGRPYLPISLAELREIRFAGITAVGERKAARPMALPPGVLPPVATPDDEAAAAGAVRDGADGGGTRSGSSGANHRQASRAGPTASPAAAATTSGRNGAGGIPPSSSSSSLSTAARGGGGGGGSGGGTVTSSRPLPESEPDPILNSANWIMPQPFDTPLPPPPPESAPAAPDGAAADGTSDGGGGDSAAAGMSSAAAAAAASLPPSAFLGDLNNGVQTTFETPPVRLFLGDRGQLGLLANWWFLDSETGTVKGPYSPEQMMLSYVAGCRELHEETMVCGTEADIRPPMLPPKAAFLALGTLLHAVNDGSTYALVTRVDVISPFSQRFIANRIRPPKPAVPAAPSPVPVVVAVQQAAPPPASTTPAPRAVVVQAAPQAVVTALPVSGNGGPVAAAPVAMTGQAPQPTQVQPSQQAPRPAVVAAPVMAAPAASQPSQAAQPPPGPAAQPSAPSAQELQQMQPPPAPPPPRPPAFRPTMSVPAMVMGQTRPMLLHGTAPMMVPGPAYGLPGPMMYVQQYGQGMPYPGPPMMVQPVLGPPVMPSGVPRPYHLSR